MIGGLSLRPYQTAAVDAALAAHRAGRNPVESLPTGSGKSVVAAAIVSGLSVRGDERLVVTVPSRELAEQNEAALQRILPASEIGVVCAALGRRELDRRILVGTPQSLAAAIDFDPTCILIDEAHQMPLHRGSWFARLFDRLPRGRATPRIGLSATTFRTADGAIFGPKAWFDLEAFAISVQDLVDLGHLAPVRYVAPGLVMNTQGVSKAAGDFNQTQLTNANLDQVDDQVEIFLRELTSRRKGMVFTVGVEHAMAFVGALRNRGIEPALIIGAMDAAERRSGVDDFKSGRRKVAVTVSAGLTGFDVPEIDLIASCRPTMSPIIHVQSIGRGTRPAEGKRDLLALDFAGNVKSFGPVHQPHFDKSGQPLGGIAPWRPCKACGTFNHFDCSECTHCGGPLAARKIVTAHDLEYEAIRFWDEAKAVEQLVARMGPKRLPVESIALHGYRKQGDPNKISCMISVGLGGKAVVRSWFKRLKGERFTTFWAQLLGDTPPPTTLEEAYSRRAELVRPAAVDLERDGNFWRLRAVDHGYDEDPSPAPATVTPSSIVRVAPLVRTASLSRPRITDADIEAGRSPKGGWTKKTLAGWGVPWPPPSGWRKSLTKGSTAPRSR